MKAQSITLTVFLMTLVACGTARPNPDDYTQQGNKAPATATKTDTKTTNTSKSATANTATTQPAPATTTADANKPATTATTPPPPAAKAPIRTLVNATEIAQAKTDYGTNCAGCHAALATSAKKGRTQAQIEVAEAVVAHATLKAAAKWPKDLKDTTDDGVDQAQLKGQAMAEALK